jgi:hypothetical protein
MTARLTATHLRAELFRTLDRVVATGEAVEVERPGGVVRISAANSGSRLARLSPHPGTISGNPEDLASLGWEDTWQPAP